MPELPEVETVARGLRETILNQPILSVTLRRKNLRYPFPKGFAEALERHHVTHIDRVGKYMLLHLDHGMIWMIHLGMSGKVLIHAHLPNELDTHDHVVMRLKNGMALIYNDPRRFGFMDLFSKADQSLNAHLKHLGADPYSDAFTPDYLYQQFSGKKTSMKQALMDQRVVAGLGNIYVCEALFLSGIHPSKTAGSLKKEQAKTLHRHIMDVLNAALRSGGSTLRDYVRSSGDSGYFQHEFKVYGREGEPCFTCGTAIKRTVQQGRSTFYCPTCQKRS